MKLSNGLIPVLIVGVLALGIGTAALRWIRGGNTAGTAVENVDLTRVIVPNFSALAAEGETAFNAVCAECHGKNAAGTKKGPPLVHDIYNPGHHADEAFFRAAKWGVPQHHWPFGNMPPRSEVTERQIAAIVRYIREMQEANGIFYRRHIM